MKEPPDAALKGRRNSRMTFAKRRVEAIVNGLPPLSETQRRELAEMLYPYASDDPEPT